MKTIWYKKKDLKKNGLRKWSIQVMQTILLKK